MRFRPRGEIDAVNVLLALAFAGLALVAAFWLWGANGVDVRATGIEDGGAVTTDNSRALSVAITVDPTGRLGDATVRFQGEDVTEDLERSDDGFVWTPPDGDGLAEGEYRLDVSVPRTIAGTAAWGLTFSVDDAPPEIDVPAPEPVGLGDPLVITGTVDEEVSLTADDADVTVDEDGNFEIRFDRIPSATVQLEAVDRAGNVGTAEVAVRVRYPQTAAVHLSAATWEDEERRGGVLDLVAGDEINAVVVDLKNECGVVTYASAVPLAQTLGAVRARLDLPALIDAVEERGGRVIGRIVTFRDPLLTRWAWANNRRDWVLQDTAGDPWPAFGGTAGCPPTTNAPELSGGFADFTADAVGQYQVDLAAEAVAAGVDDIVFVDVRRPDGPIENMVVNDRAGARESLAGFLRSARRTLRPEGAFVGAAIHPLSVRETELFDQDPALFAEAVDYLAPVIYPEGYGEGFFNVADPEAQPGATVSGAISELRDGLERPVTLVVWLQDFSARVAYGQAQVQAQVDAAAGADPPVCSWVLYDPDGTYTPGVAGRC